MKFVLATEHLYWWPVTVSMPSADPAKSGKLDQFTFDMQFAAVALDAARERLAGRSEQPIEEQIAAQHEDMIASCRGWNGVIDDAGDEVPFSEEALRSAMQMPWFREGLFEAYGRSLTGRAAREGN